jgi:PAS domain S-box-containing protein
MKKRTDPSTLRSKAEELIKSRVDGEAPGLKKKNSLQELLHELQVYQVELEMQNDELRLSQVSLEKEKARFANLFDLAPVAYILLNENTQIESYNSFAFQMLGIGRKSIIQDRLQKYISPGDLQDFYAFILALTKRSEISSVRLKFLSPTSGLLYCDVQGISFVDTESGKRMFYLAVLNISERRLAEIAQRDVSERLQMALRASNAGTWHLDIKSGHITLDSTAEELLGFPHGKFDGQFKTLLSNVLEKDQKPFDEALRWAVLNRKELAHECRFSDKKGLRYLEVRGYTALSDSDSETFVGLVTDITKRKLLEQEAAELKLSQQKITIKAIIETQEQERSRISTALHDSVGQLLYGISLKLQHAQTSGDPSFTGALALLDQAIRETRNISFELAPSILTDYGLSTAVSEMIKRVVPTTIHMEFTISGFHKRLDVNTEVFIFRILQELVNNAIKHSQASAVTLFLKKANKKVMIEMTDNGIGFIQTKPHHGMGLYSIKNRIALFNGTFKVTSKKMAGTTVCITLADVS